MSGGKRFNLIHLPTSDLVLTNRSKQDISNFLSDFILFSVVGDSGVRTWGVRTRKKEIEIQKHNESESITIHQTCEFDMVVARDVKV